MPSNNFQIFFLSFLYSNTPNTNISFSLSFFLFFYLFLLLPSTIKHVKVLGKNKMQMCSPQKQFLVESQKNGSIALVYDRHMECCLWQSRKGNIYTWQGLFNQKCFVHNFFFFFSTRNSHANFFFYYFKSSTVFSSHFRKFISIFVILFYELAHNNSLSGHTCC